MKCKYCIEKIEKFGDSVIPLCRGCNIDLLNEYFDYFVGDGNSVEADPLLYRDWVIDKIVIKKRDEKINTLLK